jgi:hypothetical protein
VHARQRSPPPVPLRVTQATSTQEVPLPPLWASLPPEHRRRLSQIMARVIAQPSLPRQQEVPDDCASSATARREGSRITAPR